MKQALSWMKDQITIPKKQISKKSGIVLNEAIPDGIS